MLRTIFNLVFALALIAVPATLCAQDLGPGAQWDLDGLTAASSGDLGGATTTSCELETCGERGGSSDPNGLTATGTGDLDGATTASCELETCGDRGAITDPDGLAAGPAAAGAFGPFLDWLRALLTF